MTLIDTAVVVWPRADLPGASLLEVRIAGLPLLIRVLLTAQRAGIANFAVVASAAQQVLLQDQLEGEPRLRGCVRWLESSEALAPPPARSLVLPASLVLEGEALRAWLGEVPDGGSVVVPDGAEVGPLAVPAALLSGCIQAALGGQSALAAFLERLRDEGRLVRAPWPGTSRRPVRSAGEVPALERAMFETLRSPDDGPIVDRYFNRRLSALLTRALVPSRVTPNQITWASLLVGLVGAWLLGREGVLSSLAGLVLFQLSVILDHVDGEIARLKFQFSRFGKWLDNFSDHAVDLAVIGFVTWRVVVGGKAGHLAALGIAAAVGVTGAFLIVFAWSLSRQRPEPRGTAPARFLAPGLATLANRDGLCLALWVMLLLGQPVALLWILALGANAYWIAWLLVYGIPSRAPATVRGPAG